MTRFLDLRLNAVGGDLATSVATNQGTSIADYQSLNLDQFHSDIRGQHVLVGTHGFHVNRADGIACLSNWERLLQLVSPAIFVGLLWPGDSVWAHGLDYPDEPRVANEAGTLLAPFLDANCADAASISFASHSLGARVVLQTIAAMQLPVRRATLMAGAIDDTCLNDEFQNVATRVGKISVLASQNDDVLSFLFPVGNFIGGIIAAGHPWWHAALGQGGPAKPWPASFQAPFQIPANWDFGHHNYLQIDPPPAASIRMPVDVPPNGSPEPANGAPGWHEGFSAAFCSTRFQ
jgi:hypothetical protein